MPSVAVQTGGSALPTGGGGGGSNASVGPTGTTAPTSATEIGIIVAGNLVGVSAANPVPISGSITATNPSVGLTGSPAPTSATEIGVIDISGNLVGASATNPVRIDPTGTTVQPVSGTITASVAAVGLTGTTAPTSAIEIGFVDGAGNLKAASFTNLFPIGIFGTSGFQVTVTAASALKVDGSAVTQPITGVVTANIGSTGGLALDTSVNGLLLAQGSNTTGQKGPLVQGAVTTAIPGYTNGDTSPLSLDPSGNLRIMGAAATGSASPGTAFNIGFVTGGLLQQVTAANPLPTTLVSPTTPFSINLTQIGGAGAATVASGVLKVGVVGHAGANLDGIIGAGGLPPNAFLMGGSDGTNVRAILTDTTGVVQINIDNVGGSAVSTAATGVIKVGAVGHAGATLDSAPGTPVPTNAVYVAGRDGGGNLQGLFLDASNNLQVIVNAAIAAGANTIGKINILGNAGAILDFAGQNASGTVSSILTGGQFNTTPTTITTGGFSPLQLDNAGNLLVNTKTGAAIAATGATAPTSAALGGLRAATTYPTAVTDGQMVAGMADKAGRTAVVLNSVRDLIGTASVQSTSASPAAFITAGGTGVFNDICELVLTNESATATIVSISDGTTTFKFALAGNGGMTKTFATPLVQGGTATGWTISNSAAVNVDAVVVYVKNK